MKKYLFLTIGILAYITTHSQDFKNAVGFRGGLGTAISYTTITSDDSEIEALLSFREKGLQFTVFSKKYYPVMMDYSEHIFLHYGFGAHMGYVWWEEGYKVKENGFDSYRFRDRYAPAFGADVSASLEYRFYRIPFSLLLDYSPFIELSGKPFFRINLWNTAICFKYNF